MINTKTSFFGPAEFSRIDYYISVVFFAIGGLIGSSYILRGHATSFYQEMMPSIVVAACGGGMVDPEPENKSIQTFLKSISKSGVLNSKFDCKQISDIHGFKKPNYFFYTEYYLGWFVAFFWWVFGPSKFTLWPIVAALHGLTLAAGFCLFRAFLRREFAIFIATVLALSPMTIAMLQQLRDYAKAPFILLSWIVVISIIRTKSRSALIGKSILLGMLIGLGTGFRSDVMVMLPAALLIMLIGPASEVAGLRLRFISMALLLGSALVVMSPIIFNTQGGGLGTAVLQGVSEPFQRNLRMDSAIYDLGHQYSDELTIGGGIAADLRDADPASYDSGEKANAARSSLSQAYSKSTDYLIGHYVLLFPADMFMRAIKSAFIIANLYSISSSGGQSFNVPPIDLDAIDGLMELMTRFHKTLGSIKGFHVFSVIGLVIFLMSIFARSRREAIGVGILLATVLFYPSLQFSFRHVFHLEFIFWIGLSGWLFVPWLWTQWRLQRTNIGMFCILLPALFIVAYGVFYEYQNQVIRSEVSALLSDKRHNMPISTQDMGGAQLLMKFSVPERYEDLIKSTPDDFSALVNLNQRLPSVIKAGSSRFLIQINGKECPVEKFRLGLSYKKTDLVWQPLFDRTISIDLSQNRGATIYFMFSAFYRPTQHFEGITVPANAVTCIKSIETLEKKGRLPSLFTSLISEPVESNKFGISFGSW